MRSHLPVRSEHAPRCDCSWQGRWKITWFLFSSESHAQETLLMSRGSNSHRGHSKKGKNTIGRDSQPHVFIYSMRSARSFSFLIPAKTILVPGMYFFGVDQIFIHVLVRP